jgi:hypothetical protein
MNGGLDLMSIEREKGWAIGFVPLLLVTGIFGAYVYLATPSSAAYPPSVITSYSGIQLRVGVNDTNLHVGQNLSISVSLFNTLSTQNNLSLSPFPLDTPNSIPLGEILGFPIAVWGGCLSPEPIQFIIVKGSYSLGELEDMSINSSSPGIVCMEGGIGRTIEFQPNSDVATVEGDFCTANCQPNQWPSLTVESNFTVNGYWGLPLNGSESNDILTPGPSCVINGVATRCVTFNYPEVAPITHAPFSPGKYTLAVSDVWGQTDLLYFNVS